MTNQPRGGAEATQEGKKWVKRTMKIKQKEREVEKEKRIKFSFSVQYFR